MTPFPPTSPGGVPSFPHKNLSKSFGEWNHYYVRCINGEVRLWMNGEESFRRQPLQAGVGLFLHRIRRCAD